MGLALDEPNDSYDTYSSNAIDVQIHPDLVDQLKQFGGVEIDFVDNGPHQRGFTIRTKVKPDDSGCSSCGSGTDGCGS